MVFNDDFLEEEYASLPQYDGTEMLPVIRVNPANRPFLARRLNVFGRRLSFRSLFGLFRSFNFVFMALL